MCEKCSKVIYVYKKQKTNSPFDSDHLHLGHLALLSKATYNKYICQKKVKQHIAIGTVRMSIEEV